MFLTIPGLGSQYASHAAYKGPVIVSRFAYGVVPTVSNTHV